MNDVLLVQNVNPSLDYRLAARASMFSNPIFNLLPVKEYTSGHLLSNQAISHATNQKVFLVHKTGDDYWSSNQYTIQNSGTFIITATLGLGANPNEIYQAYLAIVKGTSTTLISGSHNFANSAGEDDAVNVSLHLTTMKELVSGDKIKAIVYQQSGSLAHAISGQTELTINRVS